MPKTEPTKEQVVSWLETLWREQREDDVQADREPFTHTISKVRELVGFPLWLVDYQLVWTRNEIEHVTSSFCVVEWLPGGFAFAELKDL